MCRPDFYGIEYEINPWMHRERPVERQIALEEWTKLYTQLIELRAQVSLLDPVAGLPDLVFTANAAMIYSRQAVVSRFRHPQRQGEEEYDAAWLTGHGFEVQRLPDGHFFEGAGDALFCGDTLFAGYRLRSDAGTLQEVGAMFGCRVIPLELIDPYYYHLDTCFCPLAPGEAIYYPGAFDDYGRRVLGDLVPTLIEVPAEEARSFACNAVVVGRSVITNVGCPQLHASLSERGYRPIATPLGEFVKAGGSAKCLTLRLDGEEAAGWRG
jgi:N-dimethylarginine dimethylaminohydrolase